MKTVYLLCLLWVGISCNYEEVTISNALPIQFWDYDDETFNEKDVCSINNTCFCQPVNCSDPLVFQFTDESGKQFELQALDSAGSLVQAFAFTEISEGLFYLSITPDDSPSLCGQTVKFVIVRLDDEIIPEWDLQTFSQGNFTAITYGNGLFVAVHNTGGTRIYTSPDGITWTGRGSFVGIAFRDVCFSDDLDLFVAVGDSGAVYTSSDGITWTSRTAAAANNWKGVAYGDGLFVSVASNGTTANGIMSSPDGITWTSRSVTVTQTWEKIVYGNDKFVVVSQTAVNGIVYSLDGITWVNISLPNSVSGAYDIAYGDNKFVIVAISGGRSFWSLDGVTWNTVNILNQQWRAIEFGNGLFVAVSGTGTNRSIFSNDGGQTWTELATSSEQWYAIGYGSDRFVAGAGNGETGTDLVMIAYIDFNGGTNVKKSDCIEIKDSHDCSILINYSNSKTFAGIDYTDQSPNPEFSIRIPAIFFEEAFPDEHEEIDLSDSQSVRLMNKEKRQKKLDIGFMPFYMHQKLKLILAHDEVTIDGDSWIRTEPYEIADGNKRYPLRKASCSLTDKNYIVRNVL